MRLAEFCDPFTAYCNCMSEKMSENSYLRNTSAQESQIVFLADLTVLRLITLYEP